MRSIDLQVFIEMRRNYRINLSWIVAVARGCASDSVSELRRLLGNFSEVFAAEFQSTGLKKKWQSELMEQGVAKS